MSDVDADRAAADVMYGDDLASQALGITIDEVGHDRAVARMTVRHDMVNGLDVCHGGLIFTLADTAMAFASNRPGRPAFATHAEIDFVNPAHTGTRLTAVCTTVVERGRAAVSDVEVTDETGTVIAVFRGRTLAVG